MMSCLLCMWKSVTFLSLVWAVGGEHTHTVRSRFKATLFNNYKARGRFFLKSWCRIFRGSHLIGGNLTESTCLDFRPLIFQWATIEARESDYIYLYLERDIKK